MYKITVPIVFVAFCKLICILGDKLAAFSKALESAKLECHPHVLAPLRVTQSQWYIVPIS